MEDVVITEEMVKKQAKKMKNWTAPGKDEVHGFWIKHLTRFAPKNSTATQSAPRDSYH